MKLLLDSHALIWFLAGSPRLPQRLRQTLAEAEIVISAVTAWEITAKAARGKWPEAAPIAAMFDDLLQTHDYTALPITIRHAQVAGFLPGPHRHPFDRMLAAQAQVEALPLVTADPVF